MMILSVLVKWLHITAASVLVGSSALTLWGLLPAFNGSSLPAETTRKLKLLVHSSLGVLLLTGLYNAWRVMASNPDVWQSAGYQSALGTKFLLFIAVYAAAILLFRRSNPPEHLTSSGKGQLTALVGLGIVILLLSGFLNTYRVDMLTALHTADSIP